MYDKVYFLFQEFHIRLLRNFKEASRMFFDYFLNLRYTHFSSFERMLLKQEYH